MGDTKEEAKDWAESAVPRAALELQRADADLVNFAGLTAASSVGTPARMTYQAKLNAASAWYSRCYITWQEVKLMLAERDHSR